MPLCSPSGAPGSGEAGVDDPNLSLHIWIGAAAVGIDIKLQFTRAGDVGTHQLRQAKIDASVDQHGCRRIFGHRHIGLECHLGAGAANS